MLDFSDSQKKAVTHFKGPMLVLAGPGCGKTAVLTARVHFLVEHYHVNPRNILVITFTRAAAEEMKGRYLVLSKMTKTPVTFGTFHSVFFYILKTAYGYTADSVLQEKERFRIIREALADQRSESVDDRELVGTVSSMISVVKNAGGLNADIDFSSCGLKDFPSVYKKYEYALRKSRKIDFDDMLLYTYDLLSARQDILSALQSKYQYILIDEFQDINRLQYETVRLLAAPRDNLFIVGDDDQSIYGFRGSDPGIMLHFEQDYPAAKRVVLDINYRSTVQITAGASKVISQNKDRYEKNIRSMKPGGAGICVKTFRDQQEECAYITSELKKLQSRGTHSGRAAVLYRTNTQPRVLVDRLVTAGIPFSMRDYIPDIYSHWIAQDIFAYLRLSCGVMKRSDFIRVMNRPVRYISRDCLENETVTWDELFDRYDGMPWMRERLVSFKRDLKICGRLSPSKAIHYIENTVGYGDFLCDYAKESGQEEDALIEVLEELAALAAPHQTLPGWQEHIAKVRQKSAPQRSKSGAISGEAVSLMTMHAAKGLEFGTVFIMDAVEGVTPHHSAKSPKEMEEERRLFYVAMTRAAERLEILTVRKVRNKTAHVSRFVDELLS